MTEISDSPKIRQIEAALPIALLRARIATSHRFKPFTDEVGLSQPQWRVLRALAAGAPLDSRALADRCVLMPPSVSRIMRDLEKRGLIAPAKSSDRRHKLWRITAAGRQIFDVVAVKSEAVYREIEAAFGKKELDDLVDSLNRLVKVCDALPDDLLSEMLSER